MSVATPHSGCELTDAVSHAVHIVGIAVEGI